VGELDGTIIALDILPMEPIEGVQFMQGDFREDEVLARLQAALGGRPVDVVVSDMAPNLSGVESVDARAHCHLVELAVDFAGQHLKPEGALVVKLFHGSGYSQLVKLFKQPFGGQADQAQGLARRSPRLFWWASARSRPPPDALGPQRPFSLQGQGLPAGVGKRLKSPLSAPSRGCFHWSPA
jgi:hypothetical protein